MIDARSRSFEWLNILLESDDFSYDRLAFFCPYGDSIDYRWFFNAFNVLGNFEGESGYYCYVYLILFIYLCEFKFCY